MIGMFGVIAYSGKQGTSLKFDPPLLMPIVYLHKFTIDVESLGKVTAKMVSTRVYEKAEGQPPLTFDRIRTRKYLYLETKSEPTAEATEAFEKFRVLSDFPTPQFVVKNILESFEQVIRNLVDESVQKHVDPVGIGTVINSFPSYFLMSPSELGTFFDLVYPNGNVQPGEVWQHNFPPFQGINRNVHYQLVSATDKTAKIKAWMENSPFVETVKPYQYELDRQTGVIIRASGSLRISLYPYPYQGQTTDPAVFTLEFDMQRSDVQAINTKRTN